MCQRPNEMPFIPMSLQNALHPISPTTSVEMSDWTTLLAYRGYHASAVGIPMPFAIAPPGLPGLPVPHGAPLYPAQLLNQQYLPPPPQAPILLPVLDLSHTDVVDISRPCTCDVFQRKSKEQNYPSMPEAHNVLVQPSGEKPDVCPLHSIQVPPSLPLETHLPSQHLPSQHLCIQTQDFDAKRSSNRKNIRGDHSATKSVTKGINDSLRRFPCLFCDLKFSLKKHREAHMLAHTTKRPYACDQCPWTFTDKWKLAAHQRTHSGLRPYNCIQCNHSFSQKPTLTRHLRTHTGERPYICPQCPATFLDSKNLNRHMHVHIGNRGPHLCNYCNASFKRKQMLTAHMRVHNGAVNGPLSVTSEAKN